MASAAVATLAFPAVATTEKLSGLGLMAAVQRAIRWLVDTGSSRHLRGDKDELGPHDCIAKAVGDDRIQVITANGTVVSEEIVQATFAPIVWLAVDQTASLQAS